jgi:hypothetical protein
MTCCPEAGHIQSGSIEGTFMRKFWVAIGAVAVFSAGALLGDAPKKYFTEMMMQPTEASTPISLSSLNGHGYMLQMNENEKDVFIVGYMHGCAGAYKCTYNHILAAMLVESVKPDSAFTWNELIRFSKWVEGPLAKGYFGSCLQNASLTLVHEEMERFYENDRLRNIPIIEAIQWVSDKTSGIADRQTLERRLSNLQKQYN